MARILVAEDEPAVRQFVMRALAHAGHEATASGDGLAALERLAEAPFDLLLTDIVMPEMDGIALALKAAQAYPAMRILLMTGFAAEMQRAHNLDQLVNRVLLKPFTLRELIAAVAEALKA